MSAVLFAGPSLAGAGGLTLPPDFKLLPPARQGGVFRAAEMRPHAIGIIDGYFEGVPSVWHKEILWAMSRGIAVYGSASIGALRASELHACGMIGVGKIFSAYRDGVLDADDEVALQHGPEEMGFIALTEPLVNVRATCSAALAAAILDGDEADALIGAARSVFYKDRTWREIASRALPAGLSEERLERFLAWMPVGRIDQKQLDALQMIERMRVDLKDLTAVEGEFEPTFLWERAVAGWTRREIGSSARQAEDSDVVVLNELRLDPERYLLLKARALARIEMLRQAGEGSITVSRLELAAARKRHRMAHGLARAADLDRWLAEQSLDRSEYDRLIDESAIAGSAALNEDADLHRTMIAFLKLDGDFSAAAKRAAVKAAALAAARQNRKATVRLAPLLLEWFFRRRLAQEVPDDIDSFIASLGLRSREDFYGLLAEEHLYLDVQGSDQEP